MRTESEYRCQSAFLHQSALLLVTHRPHVTRPTVESRNEFVKDAGKVAEATRIQVRQIRQTGMKESGHDKNSSEGKSVRHYMSSGPFSDLVNGAC